MCIIFNGSIDFDGLEVLPVSGGESLRYVQRGGSPFRRGISSDSLCIKSISGRICKCNVSRLQTFYYVTRTHNTHNFNTFFGTYTL